MATKANVEGIMEAENCHFATTIVIMDSENNR